jgi:hypothetical protein
MTTQPSTAVGSDSAPVDARTDALNTFDALADEMFPEDEDQEEAPADEEAVEDAEPDAEDDEVIEAEEEDEALPPIDAPNSWTAEEKAAFAEMPRHLQETVNRREQERERFVQSKAQEAALARRETEQTAIQQLAEIERSYASQYEAIAQQFDVPEPDLSLLAQDQMAYFSQLQAHKNAQAQRQQAQQAASYYAQQAQQREAQAEQAYHAEQQRLLVENFPEYLDPTTGPKLAQELSAVARELGYPPELIREARATDIMAMKKVADLKAKADKFDRLQSSKMEKVRAAKTLPKVAKPGVTIQGEQVRAARAAAAFDRAKAGRNTAEKADAFADYLTNSGII